MSFKTLLKTALVLPLSCGAYTVSVTNQISPGNPSLPILDNAGNPLSTGSIGVGFFSSDNDVTTNANDFGVLLGLFQEYGTTTSLIQGNAPGLVNNVTPAAWNVVVPPGTTGGQVGQNVYVIIGNGGTLGSSSELAVWRSNNIFETDDDLGNGGVVADISTGLGDLLLGESETPAVLTAGGNSVTFAEGIRLVSSIPEPSTGLLALFAGLGLVGRRRR